MVRKLKKATRAKAAGATGPRKKPEILDEEEQILQAATIHLIRKVGGLFVATGLRQEENSGGRRWIVTVTLRYPTGHEGYVGDLLYDGEKFTMLTQDSVIDERVRQIAEDPERMRKWNEYRASTLQAGEG